MSQDDPKELILMLAKRIKDNGDLLRNAIGQTWADTALDEIRRDASEILRLAEKVTSNKPAH